MADINEYKISIETKDVSDKKRAERVRQSLQNPIDAVKNQDTIREDIAKIVSKPGSNLTEKDLKFVNQALEQLSGITKNVARNTEVKSGSKGLSSEGLIGNFKNVQDTQAKEIKGLATDLKDAANDIKIAAKELQKTVEEVRSEEVQQAGILKKKKRTSTAGTPPWAGEEEPPIPGEQPKPTKKKILKKEQNLVQPVTVTEVSKPEVTRIPRIISRRATGKETSLIESSDALMAQIKNDFIKFKNSLATTIRTRLEAEHAGSFQVVEGKGGAYTKHGGTEVLKIANMKLLTDALLKLTNSVEKTAALEKEGPAAMIKGASSHVVADMVATMGKTVAIQQREALKRTTSYINKYGYSGENKVVQKLVERQTKKESKIPISERKGINVNQLKRAIGESDISSVVAETIGKENISRVIGKAIQEVAIPKPVAGPQGLPAVKLQSGRYRALAPEYQFTPGILKASEFARKLIKTGGKSLPDKAIIERVQEAVSTTRISERTGERVAKVPNVRQMLVKNDIAGIASLSSDVMEVMKTDKKGRLKLINAYEKVLGGKGEKILTKSPIGKKEQLVYLEKLALDAKKLSLGFDDVIVAMGKLSKSNIYDRLLGLLTTESVGGKTSPIRTTMKNVGIDENAINQFNKRIREPFTQQELVDEYKPRLSYYQSKVSKVISPKLTSGGEGAFVNSVETKAALKALNRETEKYLALRKGEAGIPQKLTSQGIAESRAVSVHEDPRNISRIITNAFTEDIRQLMPLGKWSNFGRNVASTYQGIGGGRTKGGVIVGGFEEPLLKSKRSAELEKSGMWGKKGYGLNLQTVLADSAHTFEDQIEIAGKAVNRFSEYIKPKIENVKDVESAKLVA
ncbi:MAG: hypothetical protein GWP10_21755, partial [Nitrospiraceae bacterium]|nr:hypothetical protein [Nitrospiraceae bacterium]